MSVKFTYSYDMQLTGALQGTGGAHEVSMVLDFGNLSLFGSGGSHFSPKGKGGYDSRLECSPF